MYFSDDTERAVRTFESAHAAWEAHDKSLKRLEKRQQESRKATSFIGKAWAKHVTLPSLALQIESEKKSMSRARDRMIDRAEYAVLMMGREAMAADEELRGKYARMWDDYEQTRFFTRLGGMLEKADEAVHTALHAMAESDVYLKPGQTPRQIMSLSEARDTVYDANEAVITLQYLMSDRGGQNAQVNAAIDAAEQQPEMKEAIEGLLNAEFGTHLSSSEEVLRTGEELRAIASYVARMQGYFGGQNAAAAARHDQLARDVHKAFLLDEVAKAVATMPERKDLPKHLAKALGMDAPGPAARKPRMKVGGM